MKALLAVTFAVALFPYCGETKEVTAPTRDDPAPFSVVEITTPGGEATVLLADTAEERSQGLSGKEDLGGYDGMLFEFPSDTQGGFWMKDTLIPLTIAFFDADGRVVDFFDMEPCPPETARCPSYTPDSPYRRALEVPKGDLPRWQLDELGALMQVNAS